MSYTPNTWQTGDTITAAKLNNMEQGIANAGGGGGVLFVTATGSEFDWVCDKTASEMWSAYQNGVLLIKQETSISLVVSAEYRQGTYRFYIRDNVNTDRDYTFAATSDSAYPVCD
jgi:hypothetical protein